MSIPPEQPTCEKRWRSKLNHLTYPGHICVELLLCTLAAASSSTRQPVGTSIVHEASDAEHPYDHTHFAWWWSVAPNLHGTRLFDVIVDGVRFHPHAQHKKSWRWMQGLFLRYHMGFKTDAAGRSTFVQPVGGPWQVLPDGFEWEETIVTEVSEAHDLIAGVHAAGVKVRSVHDVLLLQNAKRPLPFEHNFDRGTFLPLELPPAFVARQVGTLHIWGAPLLGKTEWALGHFENPLLVTERNQLLEFRPGFHDGIVLDKIVPREVFTLQECEALTDFTQPSAIRCLYKLARIPKRTPKIVVTNVQNAWPNDPLGQLLGRRIAQLHITEKTYSCE